jgi:hypothetical protein
LQVAYLIKISCNPDNEFSGRDCKGTSCSESEPELNGIDLIGGDGRHEVKEGIEWRTGRLSEEII